MQSRNLAARADSRYADELGFLQRAFNRTLEQLGALIAAMQREADEVAASAEQLAGATHGFNLAGTGFATTAQKPPAAAAAVPLSRSSLYSWPGVRRWT